ncbi:MAG: redoxin domain-containing protein [Desulfobulbaceae bacterium]|nr:redoxin domain-containing protein [Desulfobulbaceae bacterium]
MKKITVTVLIILFALSGCSSGAPTKLKIGDPAPDFLLEDLTGNKVQLSALQNQPVVIRFFITDCKFCKADTSIFNDYYNNHKDQGLMILYITTTTDQAQVKKFAADLNIPFPVAIDYGRKISKLFNVKVEPQTIILNSSHMIKGAILGGVTEPELDEILGGEWLNK